MAKIGRNQPCPCGSGKKYKKCHYLMEPAKSEQQWHDPSRVFQLMEAKEYQRKQQQGLGRPIIATDFQGHKIVAVGRELFTAKNVKTVPDFLDHYIRHVLDEDWWDGELKKEFQDRHPILQWHGIWLQNRSKNAQRTGDIISSPEIGASMSFYGLANNLYLIQHNVEVQQELIRRLKLADKSNFHGALYETYVVAYFIKAGFDIKFEDELDRTTSHCEFTATHKITKRKFSVEAKTIQYHEKSRPKIIPKLRGALKKEADHERIVFIDVGRSAQTFDGSKRLLLNAVEQLNELETSPKLQGETLPPAYVIITNHSFWHDLQGRDCHFAGMSEGFKISTFKADYRDSVKNALIERERHKEVFELLESMQKHQGVPSTFDGENPETAFHPDGKNPPLIIGNKYRVPWDEGEEIATLTQAEVMQSKKIVMGVYEVEGKGVKMISCPISDTELTAYKRHPDTFFGKVEPKGSLKSPLDFYDWAYSIHKNSTKENLLKFMKDWPDYKEMGTLSQEELAKLYCERVTAWAMSNNEQT